MMRRLFLALLLCLPLQACIDVDRGPAPVINPDVVSADALTIATIDDESKRGPELGALLGDADYWQGVEKRGHRFLVLDVTQASKYEQDYRKVGVPCAMVWNRKTKKLLGVDKLTQTSTTKDVDKIIARYSKL